MLLLSVCSYFVGIRRHCFHCFSLLLLFLVLCSLALHNKENNSITIPNNRGGSKTFPKKNDSKWYLMLSILPKKLINIGTSNLYESQWGTMKIFPKNNKIAFYCSYCLYCFHCFLLFSQLFCIVAIVLFIVVHCKQYCVQYSISLPVGTAGWLWNLWLERCGQAQARSTACSRRRHAGTSPRCTRQGLRPLAPGQVHYACGTSDLLRLPGRPGLPYSRPELYATLK